MKEAETRGAARRRVARALLSAMAVLALGACTASAAEAPTRGDYVTQLERVCRPSAAATQRAMKGARNDIQAERDKVAAGKFAKAAAIFGRTVRQISRVPRPVADVQRLAEWFVYLGRQEAYLGQIATKLKEDETIKAQRLIARFIHNGNLANNVVLAFGFNYCSFKFSRYG